MEKNRPENCDEFWTSERVYIKEMYNSEARPDVSLAQARVEPGITTQLHSLSVREVYIILEGTGLMDDGTQAPITVGPGDHIDVAPGEPQRIKNTGTTSLLLLCLCTPRFTPNSYKALEGPSTYKEDRN